MPRFAMALSSRYVSPAPACTPTNSCSFHPPLQLVQLWYGIAADSSQDISCCSRYVYIFSAFQSTTDDIPSILVIIIHAEKKKFNNFRIGQHNFQNKSCTDPTFLSTDSSSHQFFPMVSGCAVAMDGSLKNASDIEFFNSETDTHPINTCMARENMQNDEELGLFHPFLYQIFYVPYLQAGEATKVEKWVNIFLRNVWALTARYPRSFVLPKQGHQDSVTTLRCQLPKKARLEVDPASSDHNSSFMTESTDTDLSGDDIEALTNTEVCCTKSFSNVN